MPPRNLMCSAFVAAMLLLPLQARADIVTVTYTGTQAWYHNEEPQYEGPDRFVATIRYETSLGNITSSKDGGNIFQTFSTSQASITLNKQLILGTTYESTHGRSGLNTSYLHDDAGGISFDISIDGPDIPLTFDTPFSLDLAGAAGTHSGFYREDASDSYRVDLKTLSVEVERSGVSPVPLPASAGLFGAALVVLAGIGCGLKRRHAPVTKRLRPEPRRA